MPAPPPRLSVPRDLSGGFGGILQAAGFEDAAGAAQADPTAATGCLWIDFMDPVRPTSTAAVSVNEDGPAEHRAQLPCLANECKRRVGLARSFEREQLLA